MKGHLLTAQELIWAELEAARTKHPAWPADLLRQVAIIQEEAGELQKEALSLVEAEERGDYSATTHNAALASMRREAAQLAAMAWRFLENLP